MVSADGSGVTPGDSSKPRQGVAEKVKTKPSTIPAVQGDRGKLAPEAKLVKKPNSTNGENGHRADQSVAKKAESPSPEKRPAQPVAKPKKRKEKSKKINRLVMEFQPDAVEMEHRKVAGGLRWTLYTAILLIISTITWSWWAQVDRVVSSGGKLIAVEMFVVKAPQSSPIGDIEVEFGDTVKAGQVLVTLDPTIPDSEVAKLKTRKNALFAQLSRLQAEQTSQDFNISGHESDPVWLTEKLVFNDRKRELEAIGRNFEAEFRKLDAQQAKNEADLQSHRDLIAHREETLRQSRRLANNKVGTRDQVRNDEAELKYAKSQLITAQNTIKETAAEYEVLQTQQESNMAERQSTTSLQLAQIRQQYTELLEDIVKAERASELSYIHAPEDYDEYKVIEIADRTSVVQPGEPIMRLVPANSPLEIEVKVQTKDIALIRESTNDESHDVQIKVSAFPYVKHGKLKGVIKTINEDVTEEGQPGAQQAFYYVRIQLKDEDNPPHFKDKLRPGMGVTADIKVGKRRVIDYFIYPLRQGLDSSIREPEQDYNDQDQ